MIIFILLSLVGIFSIPPKFMEKGVLVKSIEKSSLLFEQGLRSGDIIININNNKIDNLEDYQLEINKFLEQTKEENSTSKLSIKTKESQIVGLFSKNISSELIVGKIPKTRLQTGLDISGGSRALVTSEEHLLSDQELDDLVSITQERLNTFGLSDLNIRKSSDLSGNKFMVVEIAGSSPSDL